MKFAALRGCAKIPTPAQIADDKPAEQVSRSVRIGVSPICGAVTKFFLNALEEFKIDNLRVKPRDGHWLHRAIAFTEIIFEHTMYALPKRQKKIIEAALAETGGRVSGPSGAARKLGIPSTTLESRIRSLKINKHRFKALDYPSWKDAK
jgi:hypothetical protein